MTGRPYLLQWSVRLKWIEEVAQLVSSECLEVDMSSDRKPLEFGQHRFNMLVFFHHHDSAR